MTTETDDETIMQTWFGSPKKTVVTIAGFLAIGLGLVKFIGWYSSSTDVEQQVAEVARQAEFAPQTQQAGSYSDTQLENLTIYAAFKCTALHFAAAKGAARKMEEQGLLPNGTASKTDRFIRHYDNELKSAEQDMTFVPVDIKEKLDQEIVFMVFQAVSDKSIVDVSSLFDKCNEWAVSRYKIKWQSLLAAR